MLDVKSERLSNDGRMVRLRQLEQETRFMRGNKQGVKFKGK
jgi:hypothetical protein